MLEIIPNWHPIFVHFTFGLLTISGLLYAAAYLLKKETLFAVARWNLWIGSLLTIITVFAGFYAYYTVAHDTLSHAAMTNHKNWALPTAFLFWGLSLWAAIKQRDAASSSAKFVGLMLIATLMLGITGYKGAEVVYRHGTGVMRLPVIQGDGGHDSHTHGGGDDHAAMSDENDPSTMSGNDGHHSDDLSDPSTVSSNAH